MRRMISLAWCVSLVAGLVLTGCGGLGGFRKKFVRPPAAKTTVAVQAPEEKNYVRPPNSVQYEEAFFMWRVWHSESLNALRSNRKRSRNSLGQALESLGVMRGLLTEEEAAALSVHLERLKGARERMGQGSSIPDSVRVELEKELRIIETTFSPKQVQQAIRPDS